MTAEHWGALVATGLIFAAFVPTYLAVRCRRLQRYQGDQTTLDGLDRRIAWDVEQRRRRESEATAWATFAALGALVLYALGCQVLGDLNLVKIQMRDVERPAASQPADE